MTTTRLSPPPTQSVATRYRSVFNEPATWQFTAVLSMIATTAAVSTTDAMDMCSSLGPLTLAMTWLVFPTIAIASIITVAVISPRTTERLIAAALATALTAGWMYAATWASVAQAIEGTAC